MPPDLEAFLRILMEEIPDNLEFLSAAMAARNRARQIAAYQRLRGNMERAMDMMKQIKIVEEVE